MSDESFRRVARTGLDPLVDGTPDGPEWVDLTTDTLIQPRGRARSGWLAGVAVAAVILVVIGAAALFGGGEDLPPPGSGIAQSRDWVSIDYPEEYSATNHLTIWADDRIILWGGQTADVEESPTGEPGWSYELNNGQWSRLPASPKDPAIGAAGVWTGEDVIICCGEGDQFDDFAVTVAFDPETGAWRRLADAPISGTFTEAVWTGTEMLVVASGGVAAYDPGTDTWETLPSPPESARLNEVAWTGDELIVWSREVERIVHPGYALRPSTGEWRRLPDPPAWPAAPDIVWTGDLLVIWGGLPADSVGSERAVGSVYDPATDSWTAMSETLPEPDGCECNLGSQSLVWTGDRVLVSPGAFASGAGANGPILLAYDPPSDTWELVDPALLPPDFSGGELVDIGESVLLRSDRIHLSPYGWVPDGEPVSVDSWATTSSTTAPLTTTTLRRSDATPSVFVPIAETGDGVQRLTVAFLDGTTAHLEWPEGLDLYSEGVSTDGWGAANQLGSSSSRTILAIPEPFEAVVARWLPGELLATYPGASNSTVDFWAFEVDDTVNYLVFDFDPWTVLVYDYRATSGRMTEASRQAWASNLSGGTTAEGFLVLSAELPLVLAGHGDQPAPSLGFTSPNGILSLSLGSCEPGETVSDGSNELVWCHDSSEMVVAVYSADASFRDRVRDELIITTIELP